MLQYLLNGGLAFGLTMLLAVRMIYLERKIDKLVDVIRGPTPDDPEEAKMPSEGNVVQLKDWAA